MGLALLFLLALTAEAAEVRWDSDTLKTVLKEEIEHIEALAANPRIVAAVLSKNGLAFDLNDIERLDRQWRSSAGDLPLKQSLLNDPISLYFRELVRITPSYTELFLIDAQGRTAALYPMTSDYWQGDEDKWRRVMIDGWHVYLSPMEHDDSSGKNSVQLAVPVIHQDKPVGVLVVGIKLSHILAKQVTGAGKAR